MRKQTIEKTWGLGNRKYNSYEMVKTFSDQIPQQGLDTQNIARVPDRFYGQVTYNEQLQVYMFIGNTALVP